MESHVVWKVATLYYMFRVSCFCEMSLVMCCCRKDIKDDLERSRRSSLTCIKNQSVSKISPHMPDFTPLSGRLSLPSLSVDSRNVSAVKSRSSLPVCGDSFFNDSDADHSLSNCSLLQARTEYSSLDVSGMEPRGTPLVPLKPRDVSQAGSVQRSSVSTVTAQPMSRDTSDMWLTSQRPNATVVNSPSVSVATQLKPRPNASPAAVATTACNPPSGLTHTLCTIYERDNIFY